jgi:hypothetical protein
MIFSKRFAETFRDIWERSILAIGFTVSAVVLHFARVGCDKAELPPWIIAIVEATFDLFVLLDCLTLAALAVAFTFRLILDTVHEIAGYIKK